MFINRFVLSAFAMLGLLFVAPLAGWSAGEDPSWWADAASEAKQNGYELVSGSQLENVLNGTQGLLVLDVRTGYEFEDGHIPEAVNIEFDLSEQIRIGESKKDEFRQLAGNDLNRLILIYCRSFR